MVPWFFWVWVPFVVAGLLLAAMAVYQTTTRGNTISDILNSKHFDGVEAIRTEILDKVKLSTNVPIVALFLVASACIVAVPFYYLFLNSRDDTGTVVIEASVSPGGLGAIHIEHAGTTDVAANPIEFPIFKIGAWQSYALSTKHFQPMTVSARYDRMQRGVVVRFSSTPYGDVEIPDEDGVAHLDVPIVLVQSSRPEPTSVANVPSKPTLPLVSGPGQGTLEGTTGVAR